MFFLDNLNHLTFYRDAALLNIRYLQRVHEQSEGKQKVFEALNREAYDEVIKDPQLFWYLFQRSITQNKKQGLYEKVDDLNALSYVYKNRFEESPIDIKNTVEEIRKLFAKAYTEKKVLFLLPIQDESYVVFAEKSNQVDLSYLSETEMKKFSFQVYEHLIRPCLKTFCRELRAEISEVDIDQNVIRYADVEKETVHGFKIKWPDSNNVELSLIYQYEKQKNCDLSLVAKEGTVKVHSAVFESFAGDKLLKSQKEKSVSFQGFSFQTVKVLADFIYRGKQALTVEAVLAKEIDLVELFRFAKHYEVNDLISHCLVEFSSEKNRAIVEDTYSLYDGKYLKNLHEYLETGKNTNLSFIKI